MVLGSARLPPEGPAVNSSKGGPSLVPTSGPTLVVFTGSIVNCARVNDHGVSGPALQIESGIRYLAATRGRRSRST